LEEVGIKYTKVWVEWGRLTTCQYCKFTGHYSKYCKQPHQLCWQDMAGRCGIVKTHHHFKVVDRQTCPYKGKGMITHGKKGSTY